MQEGAVELFQVSDTVSIVKVCDVVKFGALLMCCFRH